MRNWRMLNVSVVPSHPIHIPPRSFNIGVKAVTNPPEPGLSLWESPFFSKTTGSLFETTTRRGSFAIRINSLYARALYRYELGEFLYTLYDSICFAWANNRVISTLCIYAVIYEFLALQYVSIIHFNVAIDFSIINNFNVYMLWQGCFCVIGVWLYRHRGFSDVTINSYRLFIGLR